MKLKQRVEIRIGEPVDCFLKRKAQQGATIRQAAGTLDVSYTTCHRWVVRSEIKFAGRNPFIYWKL